MYVYLNSKLLNWFPKWLYHFGFLPAVCLSFSSPSLLALGIVIFLAILCVYIVITHCSFHLHFLNGYWYFKSMSLHVLIYHRYIHISLLMKFHSNILHLFIWVFSLLLSWQSSLYILNTSPLSAVCLQIFSSLSFS